MIFETNANEYNYFNNFKYYNHREVGSNSVWVKYKNYNPNTSRKFLFVALWQVRDVYVYIYLCTNKLLVSC